MPPDRCPFTGLVASSYLSVPGLAGAPFAVSLTGTVQSDACVPPGVAAQSQACKPAGEAVAAAAAGPPWRRDQRPGGSARRGATLAAGTR